MVFGFWVLVFGIGIGIGIGIRIGIGIGISFLFGFGWVRGVFRGMPRLEAHTVLLLLLLRYRYCYSCCSWQCSCTLTANTHYTQRRNSNTVHCTLYTVPYPALLHPTLTYRTTLSRSHFPYPTLPYSSNPTLHFIPTLHYQQHTAHS